MSGGPGGPDLGGPEGSVLPDWREVVCRVFQAREGRTSPQGLKPGPFCAVTARLKSGPDTNLIAVVPRADKSFIAVVARRQSPRMGGRSLVEAGGPGWKKEREARGG